MVHYVFQVQEENKLCVSKIEKGNYTAGLILDQGTTKEMIMLVLLQVFHYMLFYIFSRIPCNKNINLHRNNICWNINRILLRFPAFNMQSCKPFSESLLEFCKMAAASPAYISQGPEYASCCFEELGKPKHALQLGQLIMYYTPKQLTIS